MFGWGGNSTTAVITVYESITGTLSNIGIGSVLDSVTNLLGHTLKLELVAADFDPKTGKPKPNVKSTAGYDHQVNFKELKYKCKFDIPEEFGEIGAVLIENELHKEVFIKDILIGGNVLISCESFVQSIKQFPDHKRVFFATKSYLPSQTPKGVKALREKDLVDLRGNGKGERKDGERIYDYDTYNDLGIPKFGWERPVLGTAEHPYPRRVRTGRPISNIDNKTETRGDLLFYVPRDENFSAIKGENFGATMLYSGLHGVIPVVEALFTDYHQGFPYMTEIDLLFNEGIHVPALKSNLLTILPRIVKAAEDAANSILRFETPEMIDRDKFSWFRDEEFCRQMLAGLNPVCIELVTEWPIVSKLDPAIYGPPESGITTELVEKEIGGWTTVEDAMKHKKFFILDYHDLFLPFVNKVRALERTTLYGSRTLMYLTPGGTLRPIAIELTRPPSEGKPQWKGVYTPCWDATGHWLWRFAKAHVLAHDSGYHQLVSHWLRTHCVTEPYIIATNRHLSTMHPIYRLLKPHQRYTMMINSLARLLLINAHAIIESSFAPKDYSIEISSAIYKAKWRFNEQALPADLISRGVAVEDPSAPHGLKLAIEDYPFANDALVLWDAIKDWVIEYVNHYYPDASHIATDEELQAWWTEIRTVGHGDLKDEPWWPKLETPDDLIQITSTMIWISTAHHTAVNFGQYDFAGYFPNRPTICRINMPDEDPTDKVWENFLKRPEDLLMQCFPSKLQATTVTAVLDILSSHSPEEEYITTVLEPSWEADPIIKVAFEKFCLKVKEYDIIVDERNIDTKLKNRNGAGVVPYTLLKPFSEQGVTLRGVPNSISI